MKKKIIFFSHESKLYGAPRSLLILATGLSDKYDIKIMTYGNGDLVEASREKNIPIAVVDESLSFINKNKSKNLFIRAARKISFHLCTIRVGWMLVREKPVLIYVNTIANPWPVFLAKFLGIDCIVHVRESESYIFPSAKGREKISKFIFSNAKNFICVSKSIQSLVEERLKIDGNTDGVFLTHVYNGIDFEEFTKPSSLCELEINFPEDKKIVGFLGNINPRKGLDVFIRAAQIILSERDDIVFLVVGGDKSSFSQLLESTNLSSKDRSSVFYVSFLKTPQSAFKIFDVYCMTSLAEPFARVNLEAACMGVPTVATSIHGNKEFFENYKSGLLVEPGNSEELANKIKLLVDDDTLAKQLADNARIRVQEKFTVEKYIQDCNLVIEKVLSGPYAKS